MRHIADIHQSDIFPDSSDSDPAAFSHREAARAVVLDDTGRVPLLLVGKHNYHKLPGGGIEEGEDIAAALEREIREEIGAKVQVRGELGAIVEYRDRWEQKQTTYCFIARQVGELNEPDFTEEERADGFEMIWVNSLSEAIELLQKDKPTNYGGAFMCRRDLLFLQAAQEFIGS